MARVVEWSAAARRDLAEIVRFIAEIDPFAAARVVDRIDEAVIGLGSFAIGRPGRVAGTYEKSVVGLPYIIAYALDDRKNRRAVAILHVIHGARNWPPGSWPKS